MKKLVTSLMIALSVVTMNVYAEVTIDSHSYQKVVKKKKVKWIKADKVIPGSLILYINTLKNKSKEKAENLTVVNAIPKYMEYKKGSAKCKSKCKSKCKITYSVDGGKTFNKPKKLFVKDKKTKKIRRAKAKEYTTIRWVVAKLKGGKKTIVQYKAKLK